MSSDKVRHGMAGMTASLQGSLQSLGETAELHRQRADLAESRLMEKDAIIRAQAVKLLDIERRAERISRISKQLDVSVEAIAIGKIANRNG